VRLKWSRDAFQDRDDIFEYIAQDSISGAQRVDMRFAAAQAQLEKHPHSGRLGRLDGTRELVVAGSPYLIVYTLTDSQVLILRIVHGAQEWPPSAN